MTSRRRLNRFRTFGYRVGDPWVHNRVVAEARLRRRTRKHVALVYQVPVRLLNRAAKSASQVMGELGAVLSNLLEAIALDTVITRARVLGVDVDEARELIATHRARGRSWAEVEQLMVEHAVTESRLSGSGLS